MTTPTTAPGRGPRPAAGAAPAAGTGPTAGAGPAGTAGGTATRSGPSRLAVRRGLRVGAVLLVIVVGYAVLSAVLSRPSGQGYLDINSAGPSGTRALASILRDRGVDVSGTGNVHDVGGTDPSTVVVVFPGALSASQLDALGKLGHSGHDVVLVAPDEAVLNGLGLPLTELGRTGSTVIKPDCDLPEARVAGEAGIGGGRTYGDTRSDDAGSTTVATCYLTGDENEASLAVVADAATAPDPPEEPDNGSGRFVVLGDAGFMTNRYLADDGNAALALGLLNRHPNLQWLIPTAASDEAVSASVTDLLGTRFWLVVLQIFAALVVVALWRGRRLGPVVAEQLPVVVRAAETVEGRGRLYASAKAHDRATAALRTSAAARLADRLGVTSMPRGPGGPAVPGGPQRGPDPAALVASVAEHTGRSPMEIGALLYGSDMTYPSGRNDDGAGPGDDALLRLALALDDLDRQVDTQ